MDAPSKRTTLNMRERYIIAEALAIAIEVDGRLPAHRQEPSNQADRQELLSRLFPALAIVLLDQAHDRLENIIPRSDANAVS